MVWTEPKVESLFLKFFGILDDFDANPSGAGVGGMRSQKWKILLPSRSMIYMSLFFYFLLGYTQVLRYNTGRAVWPKNSFQNMHPSISLGLHLGSQIWDKLYPPISDETLDETYWVHRLHGGCNFSVNPSINPNVNPGNPRLTATCSHSGRDSFSADGRTLDRSLYTIMHEVRVIW